MAQSPGPAETCRMAMEAAIEKGMSYCNSEEDRLSVLGQIVGLDGTEVDTAAALDRGPGDTIDEKREWVLAKANEIIETGGDDPLDAINQAWADAADVEAEPEPPEEDADEPADPIEVDEAGDIDDTVPMDDEDESGE